MSADTALLLEALTHWDAEIWMTLQAKWDLWHALQARGRRPVFAPFRSPPSSLIRQEHQSERWHARQGSHLRPPAVGTGLSARHRTEGTALQL